MVGGEDLLQRRACRRREPARVQDAPTARWPEYCVQPSDQSLDLTAFRPHTIPMDDPGAGGAVAAAVTCTYSASPAFLTSPEWANIRSAFRAAHLPLRNLHWKPVSRPSVRTIQKVDVELVPLDVQTLAARASTDALGPTGGGASGSNGSRPGSTRFSSSGVDGGEGSRSMVPKSLLERPVLNLYFVVCDVRHCAHP